MGQDRWAILYTLHDAKSPRSHSCDAALGASRHDHAAKTPLSMATLGLSCLIIALLSSIRRRVLQLPTWEKGGGRIADMKSLFGQGCHTECIPIVVPKPPMMLDPDISPVLYVL